MVPAPLSNVNAFDACEFPEAPIPTLYVDRSVALALVAGVASIICSFVSDMCGPRDAWHETGLGVAIGVLAVFSLCATHRPHISARSESGVRCGKLGAPKQGVYLARLRFAMPRCLGSKSIGNRGAQSAKVCREKSRCNRYTTLIKPYLMSQQPRVASPATVAPWFSTWAAISCVAWTLICVRVGIVSPAFGTATVVVASAVVATARWSALLPRSAISMSTSWMTLLAIWFLTSSRGGLVGPVAQALCGALGIGALLALSAVAYSAWHQHLRFRRMCIVLALLTFALTISRIDFSESSAIGRDLLRLVVFAPLVQAFIDRSGYVLLTIIGVGFMAVTQEASGDPWAMLEYGTSISLAGAAMLAILEMIDLSCDRFRGRRSVKRREE